MKKCETSLLPNFSPTEILNKEYVFWIPVGKEILVDVKKMKERIH